MARELTIEERLTQADAELKKEVEKWDEMGVNIQQAIPTNPFALEVGVKELVTMLDEIIPDFDRELFLLRWRERTTKDLQHYREMAQKQRLQAAGIELPDMAIPKSRSIKH